MADVLILLPSDHRSISILKSILEIWKAIHLNPRWANDVSMRSCEELSEMFRRSDWTTGLEYPNVCLIDLWEMDLGLPSSRLGMKWRQMCQKE